MDKFNQTMLKKFGVENNFASKEFHKNTKETLLKRYGVSSAMKSDIFKKKTIQTSLKRYGVKHPFKLKIFKDKFKQTLIQKYGENNPSKVKEFQDKKIITNLKKYGVTQYVKSDKARNISRLNFHKKLESLFENEIDLHNALSGVFEIKVFIELQNICKYKIKTQKYIAGYYVDGYIEELNLVLEYDEEYHKCIKKYDQKRENNIILDKACIFYRIKEEDWKNNKEQALNNFKQLIEELEFAKEINGN